MVHYAKRFFIGHEPEILSYLSGLTTPLSSGQIRRLNTLVREIKTGFNISALSSAFDVMYVLGGETAESSLRNLVKRAHDATTVNSPTWTQFEGYISNGTSSYLRSNYTPSTDMSAYGVNSASLGVYSRTNNTNDNWLIGSRNGLGDRQSQIRINTSNSRIWINSNDIVAENLSGIRTDGLLIGTRTANNITKYYRSGTDLNTDNFSSSNVSPNEMYVCAVNNNGTI
jgi:hypothetical protein